LILAQRTGSKKAVGAVKLWVLVPILLPRCTGKIIDKNAMFGQSV